MLRVVAWEVFEWLFILFVLIGAVVGVALYTTYTTAWIVTRIALLPLRLAKVPREQGREVRSRQDGGTRPVAFPAIHRLSKAA